MHRSNILAITLLVATLVLAACVPVPATPQPPMSLEEARQIATNSVCSQAGQLTDTASYNPNSNTWWIDLAAEKAGCNPACVVDVAAKTAGVNWRCTGANPPSESSQIANPASVNCEKQGGKITIETGLNGGQYGVCVFEDNLQCEEWALFRGDCPVGGVKVTGYVTAAGRFCAITGGQYALTSNSGAPDEQGTCTLQKGKVCDAAAYYAGECIAE